MQLHLIWEISFKKDRFSGKIDVILAQYIHVELKIWRENPSQWENLVRQQLLYFKDKAQFNSASADTNAHGGRLLLLYSVHSVPKKPTF